MSSTDQYPLKTPHLQESVKRERSVESLAIMARMHGLMLLSAIAQPRAR